MKPCFERDLLLPFSPNETESQSIRFGTFLADGSPALVHKQSLSANLYLRGAPGSGKTAMLASLIELLLSWGRCHLHLLDLKDQNTMELFATMRAGAARSGMRVRWFCDDVGKSTHTFNLFLQPFWRLLTPMQKAGLVGAALGSSHGLEGYGTQYFGGAAFEVYVTVFERFEVESWADLREKLKLVLARPRDYGLTKKLAEAASQSVMDVGRLARIAPLNAPFSSIDLCSNEPQAIYWSFPGAYDMAGVISRLVVFSLFAAADNVERRLMTWLCVDEFQRCLGNRMDLVFQQARGKIGLLLANQCLADLRTADKDYTSTVKTCCRLHWTFNAADEDEQIFMSHASGKVTRKTKTTTYTKGLIGQATVSTSYQEAEVDRLGLNEISLASAQPDLSLLRCTQDHGFMQFGGLTQVIHTEFHITKEEHQRREQMPWPGSEDGTINGEMPPLLPVPLPPGPKLLKPPTIVNPGKPPRRAPKNPLP